MVNQQPVQRKESPEAGETEARLRAEETGQLGDEIGPVPGAPRTRIPLPLTRLLGRVAEMAISMANSREAARTDGLQACGTRLVSPRIGRDL